MGDRVAVLQKGGVLAQYATPPELLMSPAERLRRGLRRRRSRAEAPVAAARARHRSLEGAARARGEPTAEVRAALAEADVPHPLVDRRRGPAARLALRARPRPRDGARERPTRRRTRSSSSTTCCATRCRTCCGRTPSTGRSWTSRAAWPACCRSRSSPTSSPRDEAAELATGRRARAPRLTRRVAMLALALAAGRDPRPQPARAASHRTSSARAGSSTTSTATRTRCCSTSCWSSCRWRSGSRSRSRSPCWRASGAGWSGRSSALTGVLYTLPSLAVFFLLLPITGRGTLDGGDRAHRLHAADHLPQHHHRARQRARGGEGRGPRHGPDRPAAAVAGGAAARAARHHRRACGSPPPARSAWRHWPCSPARAGSGSEIIAGSNITFKTGVVAAGGLALLLALALDVILLARSGC